MNLCAGSDSIDRIIDWQEKFLLPMCRYLYWIMQVATSVWQWKCNNHHISSCSRYWGAGRDPRPGRGGLSDSLESSNSIRSRWRMRTTRCIIKLLTISHTAVAHDSLSAVGNWFSRWRVVTTWLIFMMILIHCRILQLTVPSFVTCCIGVDPNLDKITL